MGSYEKIVETLRRCAKEIDCDGCPYYHEDGYWCDQKSIATDAAAAIEALQAQLPKRGEIVRCRECRWGIMCVTGQHLGLDGFCSNGKREVQE